MYAYSVGSRLAAAAGVLLVAAPWVMAANRSAPVPVVLHEAVGPVVDAAENERYGIFSSVTGFECGRLVRKENGQVELHLLRNLPDRAQRTVFALSGRNVSEATTALAARIESGAGAGRPLFEVPESAWNEKSTVKQIALWDGGRLFASLARAHHDTLSVITAGGLEFEIPEPAVASMEDEPALSAGGAWRRTDPNTSRLFFAPTGRRLKKGTGYFADYFIFFPTLAYGLSDAVSLSGGVSLLPGAKSQLVFLAPKVTVPLSSRIGAAAGVLHMGIPEEEDVDLVYAVATYGDDTAALTAGACLPLAKDSKGNAILLLGGEKQVSNRIKIITENWIFTGADMDPIFSGGIRFFGDQLSADIALVTTSELIKTGGFPFVPMVAASVFFGR